jgi:hypothetical protein
MTFNIHFFFSVTSKRPAFRKHEPENTALEKLSVEEHRLYTHFLLYTHIYLETARAFDCIVNHVENNVPHTAVLLLAGRQPAKALN